jgi:RNA polymerase sigma-70 factor (ECF subfamily)
MQINPADIRLMVRVATQRTGTPLHDEDLEQDAMVKALEALRRRRDIRHPRAFLMKVVNDAVSDYWRRRRTMESLDLADDRFVSLPEFEDRIDRIRREELLQRALRRLDPGKRAILDSHYSDGCTIAEIACRLNRSQSAVKMELMRTRRILAGIVRTLAAKKSRTERHS